ncbi:MAG: DUF6249 domain-containing protein [Pseudomonadota bacterium]
MHEDIIIPVVLFGAIVAIVWLVYHFGQRKRQIAHETLRHAIDKGQQVSPELIERMTEINDPRRNDIRKSVLIGSIGLSIALLAFILPIDDDEGIRGVLAGAVFPLALSFAYLGLWAFGHGRRAD